MLFWLITKMKGQGIMDKPFAMIIEDEPEIAALFRYALESAGYRTEIVLHGQVAVERLSNSRPDVVLLDLRLPVVSGIEILKIIRNDRRFDQTKIIVVSAHAYMVEGLPAEPDFTLLKPISVEQLTKLVSRIKPSKPSYDKIHQSVSVV